jgi:chitin disaccharide deacetylase
LLPPGTIVRRNFSFLPGEKSGINRGYRMLTDWILARQHRLTDLFYSLPPLEPPQRLDRIFRAAKESIVEVETHPVNAEEYRFLREGGLERWVDMSTISRHFVLPDRSGKRRAAAS